jgi:hypothetical protein
MINKSFNTRKDNIAFVVTPDQMKRLATILEEVSTPLEYTVTFSNGTGVTYSRIEDVISQPNSEERSIVTFSASTTRDEYASACVNLRVNDFPSLVYTIKGTQKDVTYVAEQLDDWVAAIRQWHSPFLSTAPSTTNTLGMLLVMGATFLPILIWVGVAHSYPALFWLDAPGWRFPL